MITATSIPPTRHVLIADNDMIIRNVLRSLLSKVGLAVDHVGTTEQALTLAMKTPYDFVLLDLDMPTDGGLQVCRRLREDARYRDVPITVLTALRSDEVRHRVTEAGATLFLTKPFNPADFMRAVAPLLHLPDQDQVRLTDILRTDRGLFLQDGALARAETMASLH